MKNLTPWHDENGNLNFPYRAIRDRVLIYPSPLPETIGEKKLVILPNFLKKYYQKGTGILLSVGPGYWDDKGKWHPTSDQMKPGIKVQFDKTVPWKYYLEGLDGREYSVVFCGYQDVRGVFEE